MDLRIIESREKIAIAFFQLLKDSSFEGITISEIVGLAQVSRNTYYRHFKNKMSILSFLLDDLIEDYFFKIEQLREKNLACVLELYFSFWLRHLSLIRILEQQKLQGVLLDRQRKKMPVLMKNSSLPWHGENSVQKELLNQLMIGGAWNLLLYHLEKHMPIHPGTLSKKLVKEIKDTLGQDINLLFTADF